MAAVQFKNVKKIYPRENTGEKKKKKSTGTAGGEDEVIPRLTAQGTAAVRDFNLDIADKEFIVLVGPSGCGKSTVLRMVAGLEDITEGEICINGRSVNNVPPKDRDIAMVFQNYALYPHMTVYQNMAFPLKIHNESRDVIDKKVREAAEILGITRYLGRKPKSLSGGQRQRVAIGRAIVRNPSVFLMDEPLSNLDTALRNRMRTEIIKLRKRINTTFIYVTHDQTEAMTLGDRIVIMKDGCIQQIGTPQEVFNRPYNLFVAGFIGSPQMNFFDAELVKENGRYSVALGGIRVELSEDKQARLASNNVETQKVTLGIRPEHTCLADTGIEAAVDVSEMMGSSIHLHVTAEGMEAIIIVPMLNAADSRVIGDRVHFSFGGMAAHVFSKETGKNLEW